MLGRRKKFWRCPWGWLPDTVNVLNATELPHVKRVRMVHFKFCVFSHNKIYEEFAVHMSNVSIYMCHI